MMNQNIRNLSGELSYIQTGDYLLPEVSLSEPPQEITEALGSYARMRKAFLKEHRTITYNTLLLSEQLYPHLRETEIAAQKRMQQILNHLMEHYPLPDKETSQLAWTAALNSLKIQAEEMVLHELIYA